MSTTTQTVRSASRKRSASRPPGDRAQITYPSTWFAWILVAVFLFVLVGVLLGVVVDSFAAQWFSGWWPADMTFGWYAESWNRFNLGHVTVTTLIVAGAVVVISAIVGVPAAYQLARRNFPGKKLVLGLFLLPVLMPPMTYGIPLATVMYNFGLGRTLIGVILVNVVPAVPFVILTMTPFIEQINPTIESAARMSGAPTRQVFLRILAPLLAPGLLAAAILVLVRTVGLFELTFLVSGPDTDTLIVALYRAMTSAGGTVSRQLISSISVIYSLTMAIILIVSLRFVNPTQLVTRVNASRTE